MTDGIETPLNHETSAATEPDRPAFGDEIIARPYWWYRFKHVSMGLAVILAGLWFALDGYKRWPAENRRIDEIIAAKEQAQRSNDQKKVDELATELNHHSRHTDMDILIQKLLCFSLPVVGIAYIIWTLYATRGRYTLRGHVVQAPGTPEIAMNDLQRLDKRRWDRKGIALVFYEAHQPRRTRTFRLDDFAYDRDATDAILERIEAFLHPEGPRASAAEAFMKSDAADDSAPEQTAPLLKRDVVRKPTWNS